MITGKCFGGPYDGQMLTHEHRERVVHYDPKPCSLLDFDPNLPGDPVVTLNRGVYRFADGHGWVWHE